MISVVYIHSLPLRYKGVLNQTWTLKSYSTTHLYSYLVITESNYFTIIFKDLILVLENELQAPREKKSSSSSLRKRNVL